MDETKFPPNSRTGRIENKAAPEPEKKPRVESVVTGKVIHRKTPLGKRFKELFVGGDASSVANYILFEVLLPAARDAISDAVSQGVDRMIYGESRRPSRPGYRPGGSSNYTPYNRYSSPGSNPPWRADRGHGDRPEDRRNVSRRARSTHDFGELVLPTRGEAEEVLDGLYSLLSQYEQATVSDFYDLCGITPEFTDEKYGWTSLEGSRASRTRDGWVLDLPKPEILR